VTAQQFAPICDGSDPALRVGTIRPDRTGLRVVALQIALVNLGYDMPVDGRYGPITESAVVDFQIDNSLIVDGITGRQTQTALGI
jgi:peptidoglycan hydrolase-like protein with peptidoglycan-binding domain